MQFKLNIHLGNDAMQTPTDIAGALRVLANNMDHHTAGNPHEPIVMGEHTVIAGNVFDDNGNTVGYWDVKAEEKTPNRYTVDRIKLNDQLTPIWNEAGLEDEEHDDALNDLTHEVADRIEKALSGD